MKHTVVWKEENEERFWQHRKMKKSISESSRPDRKTVERNRRIHMKGLCFKLASLIPSHHFKHSKVIIWFNNLFLKLLLQTDIWFNHLTYQKLISWRGSKQTLISHHRYVWNLAAKFQQRGDHFWDKILFFSIKDHHTSIFNLISSLFFFFLNKKTCRKKQIASNCTCPLKFIAEQE